MSELENFLENNEKDLVDFIENNERPIAFNGNIYARLLTELVKLFPHTNNPDKAHIELTIAIIESFWCGWISQAKANKTAYPSGMLAK